MGHQFSKQTEEFKSPEANPRRRLQQQLKNLDNDGLSRATELTGDESISPPPSPSVAMFAHSQSWRRNAIPAVATGRSSGYPVFQEHHQQLTATRHSSHGHYLVRRDSDPGRRADASERQAMQPQRSEPVKCPPQKSQSVCGYPLRGDPAAPSEEEEDHGVDASFLERMYDSRTWEMYRRITEARKRSKTKYSPTNGGGATAATTTLDQHLRCDAGTRVGYSEDTSEWENLQHEEGEEKEQHEMVFLFDF